MRQKITPFLWFDDNAEEAAKFYTGIFKKSRIGRVARYSSAGANAAGRPAGSVMTVEFELEGQQFVALNGGPHMKFNEAISLVVNCKTQAELDYYWKKLSAEGKEVQCGWLRDRYGVAWQIVPESVWEWLTDKDAAASQRVMAAVLQMTKLDIGRLKKAHKGETGKIIKRGTRRKK